MAFIVEGHGDRDSAPILFRRVVEQVDLDLSYRLRFHHPIRVSRDRLTKRDELERAVNLACRKVRPGGCVLLLIDADTDCPAELGPELLRRACAECGDIPIAVAIAKAEFENWFIAAAESIRGEVGLSGELECPLNPEGIGGAKEWLTRHMSPGETYSETLHQARLASVFDLEAARQSDSFDKCFREIVRVARAAANRA